MQGFMGTKASMLSDVSLILETIIVAGIMYGWYLGKKHKSSNHHWLMLVMVFVDIAFLAVYMIHRVVDSGVAFEGDPTIRLYVYLPIVIVHSIISSVAFLMGAWLSVQGIRHHVKDSKPGTYVLTKEYRPRHAANGVWTAWAYLISAITGIAVYYMLYMM